MRKRIALALIFLLALVPALTRADIPVTTISVAVTGTGAQIPITLIGQSTCNVAVTGTFTGLSATAQVSGNVASDPTVTWSTATSINSGSAITAVGSYPGAVAGYRQFRVNVTAISTGTANLTYSCDASTGSSSSGGGGGSVTQGTTPWTVNTPAPAPTGASGALAVEGHGTSSAPVYIGALANPCLSNAWTWVFFTTSAYLGTSGSPTQLLTATASQNGWICKTLLTNTTTSAVNITVAHSTSGTCASMTIDFMFSLAANGGIATAGFGSDYSTPAANQQTCMYASAASSIIGAVAVLSH